MGASRGFLERLKNGRSIVSRWSRIGMSAKLAVNRSGWRSPWGGRRFDMMRAMLTAAGKEASRNLQAGFNFNWFWPVLGFLGGPPLACLPGRREEMMEPAVFSRRAGIVLGSPLPLRQFALNKPPYLVLDGDALNHAPSLESGVQIGWQ